MKNYLNKKRIQDINFSGKKVIVRCDFNVPISNGVISDNKRITAAIETIQYLYRHHAKIILMSHLGRVKTNEECKKQTLKIVAIELSQLLKLPVTYIDENYGDSLTNFIAKMQSQDICLIKNTRCQDVDGNKESGNNPQLAKYWASLCDVFVNDAFATSHRAHASTAGIAQYAKESCIGFLIEKEITSLHKAIFNAKRPLVVIIGGAKVSDKISTISNLAKISDHLLIGGGMTYTFYKMLGYSIGTSLVENDKLNDAKQIYNNYKKTLLLPDDSAQTKKFANGSFTYTKDQNIDADKMGLDIGLKTIKKYSDIISKAKTIIWNGPVGVFEFSHFATGTIAICQAIAHNKHAYSVIGGGDSATAVKNLGYENEFSYISTGGGASLCYFEGKDLIALNYIQDK